MSVLVDVDVAIETAWMILEGLGYRRDENPQLEQTVREVYATALTFEAQSMDRRKTKSLDGKCGSCRFFELEPGEKCTGYCSGRMKQKGRLQRTYKCIGYEATPVIIPASEA